MVLIAVDPGGSGGICWQINNHKVLAANMGSTPKDIYEQLKLLSQADKNVKCYIERVGNYVAGNAGPGAVKFAKHCGHLEGFLIALEIPYYEILPATWQAFLIGKPNHPKIPKEVQGKERKQILAKRKTERKNKIKIRVQGLYPHLKITLATSDALGILCYAVAQENK